MLKIELLDTRYRPIVTCDWCEKPIVEATDGNYEYEIDGEGRPRNEAIFFTHTECCRAFEEAHGGAGHWRMDDLRCFPLQLGVSLLLNWNEAEGLCARDDARPGGEQA